MWKNKEQPVVKTGKMCRIAQNYEHGRALPLHAVRWLGIMIDSQNIPLRRMSTNEIRYRRSNAGFHIFILLHKRHQSLIQRGFTQNQPNYKFIFLYAAPRGNGVKMA